MNKSENQNQISQSTRKASFQSGISKRKAVSEEDQVIIFQLNYY